MTFRTRTFVALLLATLLALVASTSLVNTTLRRMLLADIEESLLRQARLAAELLANRDEIADPDAEADVLEGLIGSRITFILDDGRVVGDSQVTDAQLPTIDNHLYREEVQAALRAGVGVAVRRSATTGVETMYAAATMQRGPIRIVRIGLPLTRIDERIAEARRIVWLGLGAGLAAALLLTWITSAWLARRVQAIAALARQYRQGDFRRPQMEFGRDELGTVARALDETARDLGTRLDEVARERAHMDAILEGMAEGALLVDGDGRLVLSNTAIRDMLRLTDAPPGSRFLEIVRQPDIAAMLTAALEGHTPPPADVQLDPQARRTFIARAVPVEAARGGGAVLVLHDVTERRRAEQVRRDFVANVSHELRTPLTAIRGYVEALRDAPADEAQAQRFLGIIARHATRMERLVSDLLRLARLDARQEPLELSLVPIGVLLDQVTLEMEGAIDARRITVDVEPALEALTLRGDPAKLHDVFRNLLENAVNYSPEDGRITWTVQRNEGSVAIAVTDQGPGIPEAELPRIFERFYRVDRSRTRDPRDPGGTGLGLSIVRHLVELHGGTVSARNRPDGGACVELVLPDPPAAA